MSLLRTLRLWAFIIAPCAFALGIYAETAPPPPKLRFLFLDETPGHYALKVGVNFRQVSANP